MKTKNGLTLVEVLTVIAVGGVVLSLTSIFFLEFLKTWQKEESGFSSWQAGYRLAGELRRDIRRALPGGLEYIDGGFKISCTGEISPSGDYRLYSAHYFLSEENNSLSAVRKIYLPDGSSSENIYRGIELLSLKEAGPGGLVEIIIGTAGGETVRELVKIPSCGVLR